MPLCSSSESIGQNVTLLALVKHFAVSFSMVMLVGFGYSLFGD